MNKRKPASRKQSTKLAMRKLAKSMNKKVVKDSRKVVFFPTVSATATCSSTLRRKIGRVTTLTQRKTSPLWMKSYFSSQQTQQINMGKDGRSLVRSAHRHIPSGLTGDTVQREISSRLTTDQHWTIFL
jgi:hypothetical protein